MILYIGNKMSIHGMNPSSVETLGYMLKQTYSIRLISEKKNPWVRAIHIVFELIRNVTRIRLVLLDMYSSSGFYYSLMVAFLCKIFFIPYVPILHGGNLPQRYYTNRKLVSFILRFAKVIVAPSGYLFHFFSQEKFERLLLIPNCLELNLYDFKPRVRITPKFLWVRSFHKIYNPLLAIRVFLHIKSKFPEASMTMVGAEQDGSMAESKLLAIEKGIADSITFTGRLPKTEWIKLSVDFDIFLNTTNFDNMPVSVLEGMALGLPIVSTNVGGLPYLLEDGEDALLVEANDEQRMVEKIETLLLQEGLGLRLSKAARNKVEGFDWKIIKHQWHSILSQ
jgi:L-malate glycosyltransferase